MTIGLPAGRALRVALVVLPWLFAAPSAAQGMLQNGDFETWSGGAPTAWNLLWPNNMTSPSTTEVHCGATSCQVDVVGNYSEVGKQMGFAVPPTGVLRARIRVLYPPAAQQPSGVVTGTLTLRVAGYVSGVWTPVGGSSAVVVSPSPHWQEFQLAYVPGTAPTADLIRCFAIVTNGGGQRYFLDSVDFAGSSPVYGALQASAALQVRSTALSLIFDDSVGVKRLRELRRVTADGTATGPNYLETVGAAPGSLLYDGYTVPSVTGAQAWFNSSAHALTVSAITPTSPLNRTGWRFQGGDANVAVDLAIYSEAGRAELFFDPTVTPNNRMLEEFICPALKFAPYLQPGAVTSQLALPIGGGALMNLDAQAFAQVASKPGGVDWIGGEYPGSAALQLMALYTDTEGVGLMAMDGNGENKNLTAILTGSTPRVELRITHRLPSVLASTPVATFRRALVPCVGDWRHAADQYRDWMRTTALWGRAASRPTAAWVAERPTLFEADLMPQGIGEDLVPIDDWDKLMDDWRAKLATGPGTGAMLPLFRSFEQNGTYIGPNYLPLQVLDVGPLGGPYPARHGEATILSSWLDTHNQGHRPMAMVAGLKWAWGAPARAGTIPLAGAGCVQGAGVSSYWQYSFSNTTPPTAGAVVKDRQQVDVLFALPPNPASWEFSHYVMDPRHAVAIGTHMGLARRMATGGLDLYLFDQMNGGAVPDNFNPAFGSPGAGAWKAAAVRNLYAATLVAGRAVNPDFELSIEDPCEQVIDLVAVQGFRADQLLEHPARNYARSEAIPLFPYVFHEVLSFVNWDIGSQYSDWVATQPWAAATVARTRQLVTVEWARTLVAGGWLGTQVQPWTLVLEYEQSLGGSPPCGLGAGQAMVPWFTRADASLTPFLQACVATSQGPARSFLNSGRMVRAHGLSSIGTVTVHLQPWTATGPTFLHPVICHSAWEQAPGFHGLLLANVDAVNAAVVTLPYQIGSRTLLPGDLIKVHTNGGAGVMMTWSPGLSYPVPPASVVFMTM